MSRLHFKIIKEAGHSRARAGHFTTLHGEVQTPIFMPVGTQATVKSQTALTLKEVGSNVLLANTYHLLLRPGIEVFKKFGGIHQFMNWDRPVLTDSGGFQIFSLPHSRQMNEEGAVFKSYVDGTLIKLTPELSIETQKAIGSDIMMVLDQCIPSTSPFQEAKRAMELTHRWAKRSLAARGDSPQSMFGIVQGACFPELRKQSAEFLAELPFDGLAVGGLAVGESKQEREDFTELTTSFMPKHLPRYLMGVGTPIDILEAVHRGIDMFDCILPSQLAQRGVAFTTKGKLQLRRSVYKFSEERLDPDCICHACSHYSKAYLHHLNKADEVLGWHLLSLHNLTFYHRLMREIREAILEDRFLKYYEEKRKVLVLADEEQPAQAPKAKKIPLYEKHKDLGDFEVHTSVNGFCSIKQKSSGEVMHSVNPPDEEAFKVYVEPSKISERLKSSPHLVIWDVGLGAAHNAMAAIREVLATAPPEARVLIHSFENDLDSLRLALKNRVRFPHLHHAAPGILLEQGEWTSEDQRITWKLHARDFFSAYPKCELPDLIYYDPFSIHTNGPFWTYAAFQKLKQTLGAHSTTLFTYSVSTAVRAALLAAGFWLGRGVGTGPKSETTVAFSQLTEAQKFSALLGTDWLGRYERSQAKFPPDVRLEDQADFEVKVKNQIALGLRS